MKHKLLFSLIIISTSLIGASYTWNGSTSTAWNLNANWTPSSGFPVAGDDVVILTAANLPTLDATRTISSITMTSGTLNLNSFTLTTTGTSNFNGGTINNGTINPTGTNTSFNGTTFGAIVTAVSSNIWVSNSTFNSASSFTQTGGSDTYSGAGNTYNADVTFSNTGPASFNYGYYSGSTNTYNGNIYVNNTGGGNMTLGYDATSVLAATKTILIGGLGVTNGGVTIGGFTQADATPLTINLASGTGYISIYKGTWTGVVNITAPRVYTQQATYNNTASFTQTGNSDTYSSAGNTYNADVTFSNTGPASFNYGYYSGSTNTYNGNIYVNNTGGGNMTLGYDATSVLAATKTILVGGLGVTNGGVTIGSFTQADATPLSINLASGTGYISIYKGTWTGTVSITAPRIFSQRVTYNNATTFTKTGNFDDYMSGGNTFNGVATFNIQNNSNWFWNHYNAGATAFNNNIVFTSTGTGSIYFGWNETTGCTSTLAAGRTISVGGTGFNTGTLGLGQFLQADATTLTITLGTGARIFSNRSIWTGIINFTAGGVNVERTTCNNTATFTKTGSFDDYFSSGNTFNGVTTFNMQGTANWFWNHYNAGVSTFNQNIVVTNTSTGGIYFGWGEVPSLTTLAAGRTISVGGAGFNTGTLGLGQFSQADATTLNITLGIGARIISNRSVWTGAINFTAGGVNIERTTCNNTASFTKTGSFDDYFSSGNTFNGITTFNMQGTANWFWNHYNAGTSTFNQNIVVTNTSTGGIYFGFNEIPSLTTLAAGRTISVGGAGFNTGTLGLGQFNQADATTLNVTLGIGARIISNRSVWTGAINFTAGGVNIERTTCNNTATFTKTGSFDDYFSSGNTFNGITTFNMQGTANWFWNHYNAGVSTFNQNIVVTNTSTGGIYFGWNEVPSLTNLAAGRTISVGGAGFNTGTLGLGQFNQADATTLNVTLGTGARIISNRSVWTGAINFTSGGINIERTTCNNTASFTKTGSFDDYASAGNTFNGITTINMQSPNNWFWNHYDVPGGTTFNNNLLVTNTSSGGLYFGFGYVNIGCITTLGAGRTISVGGAGFASGTLGLGHFAQADATTLNLTLTGSSTLYVYRSTFTGAVNFTAGAIRNDVSTFNGASSFNFTGSGTTYNDNGNVFNSTSSFTMSGTGNWHMSYYNSYSIDDYNGAATFIRTGTGQLYPACNNNNTMSGNISTTGSTFPVTFGVCGGFVTLDGSSTQTFTGGTNTTIFRALTVNNTSVTGIVLNAPVIISSSITMTDGIINTSGTNFLVLNDNAIYSGFSLACYVNGPMKKIGDDSFIFPVGKNNYIGRLSMVPSSGFDVSTEFTCEYTEAAAPNNNNPAFKGTNINHVSGIEYWDLSRVFDPGNNASCNVTLYWESETRSGITNMADLCVAHLSSSTGKWENQGGTGVDLGVNGYITSTVALSNFSPLTFGSRNNVNPLPIQLLSFKATLNNKKEVDLNWITATETNNNFFTIERSVNGINFEALETINSKGINGNSNSMLNYATLDKQPLTGISYYRLKQTDYDGTSTYSNIETVEISGIANFSLFPNPASKEQLPMLSITPNDNQSILVVVIDATGKEVYSKIVIVEKEVNQVIALDPEGKLAAGFYNIKAASDNNIFNAKLIIR